MIYYHDETYGSNDSRIVAHIKGEFVDVCDDDGMCVDVDNIEEVARAVDLFIRQEMHCSCVSSEQLIMLASRAMASLGSGNAARRFLLFGAGMIRPSEWEIVADDCIWILDLKQMALRDDAALELVFFSALDLLLESIADIWDESAGKGTLALRHVCSVAASLLGCDDAPKKKKLVNEIQDSCKAKLRQIGEERRWAETPRVMNLDIS